MGAKLFQVAVVFFSLSLTSVSFAETPESISRRDMDGWLQKMGLRNYSAELEQARKDQAKEVRKGERKQIGLSPVADQVMAFSQKRYQAVNDARDLATWMYERTKGQLGETQAQAKVADFTARMLILQPQELPDEWPAEVQTAAERESFTTRFVAKQILNASERVANDFIATAYGAERVKAILADPKSAEYRAFQKDLQDVRGKVLSYVSLMQMDTELGQSNYLGDALALTFTRHSRKAEGPNGKLETFLAASAIRHGTRLENSITAEPVLKQHNGEEIRVKVGNGSFVYEYSGHREAADIAFAGKPSWGNSVRAYFKGWLGSALSRMVHWEDGKEPDLTTYLGRIRAWLADSRPFNHGVSHVGQAFHNVDPETGIVHLEIRDLYPDPVFGGERIITMRNFAQDGPFRRFMVSMQDPEKLAAEFIRQVEANPEITHLWKSIVSKYDRKNDSVEPTKREKQWPVLFDETDIQKWVELAKTDPKAFADLYAERARVGWDFFLHQGVHFDTGFTDFLGAGYCAKGCVLAPKLTMGLDVEPQHSRLSFPLALLSRMGVPGLEDLPIDRRFVAPVSLAMQPSVGEVQVVDYPAMSSRERQLARTEPFVPQPDFELRTRLQSIPWSASPTDHDGTYLGDLLGAVEENVQAYRLALDKGGPSKVLGGSYAARARARREEKAKNTEGEEEPVKGSYHRNVAVRTVEVVEAAAAKGQSEYAAGLQEFLKRMGLAEYSKGMQKTLDEGKAVNELAQATLEGNVSRYRMVDTARNLAVHILERARPNLQNIAFRERFLPFAASLLNMKPEAAVKEVPLIVRQNPDLLRRAEEIEKYFEGAERERGRQQLERFVSNYLGAMYGEENLKEILAPDAKPGRTKAAQAEFNRMRAAIGQDIAQVSKLFADYLYKIHLDPHIGQTQWVGRGVALGLVRESRLGDPTLEKEFSEQVRRQDLFLENFVSNHVKMRDAEGHIQTNTVHTGSFAYGRGRSRESIMIPSAALPADTKQAKKEGLVGNILNYFIPVEDGKLTQQLDPITRLRLGLAQIDKGNPGFSHVGQFIVYEDAQTGIASTLVADNYPYHDESKLAGVRFVGLEHFGSENGYGWIGIADIDPEKFHKYAQEMVQRAREQGWDPVAWKSYKPTVDADGKVVPVIDAPRADWMKLLTQEEFEKMHSEKDPQVWMENWRRALERGWRIMMEEGTHFSWVDNGAGTVEVKQPDGSVKQVNVPGKYWEQGTYCSQGCTIASIRMTGLPLEEPGREGRWAGFVKFLAKWIPIPDAKAIDVNAPIVPPNNLALQKWMKTDSRGNHIRRVQYPINSIADHQRSEEGAPGVEKDLSITTWLRSAPEFIDVLAQEHNAHIDPVERANAIHSAMERTAVRAVAAGAHTVEEVLGVDPEKVAEAREAAGVKVAAMTESVAAPRSVPPRVLASRTFLGRCQNAMAGVRGAVRSLTSP